jgi:D-alanyl-D-alanine carboxypeptidase
MLRLLFLMLMLSTSAASAQVPAPDTPAGKVFAAWLSSFNSGDAQQMAAFDKTYQQTSVPLKMSQVVRERSGGFTLMRIERSEPHALEVLLKDKDSDAGARLSVSISTDLPTVILSARLGPANLPAEFLPQRMGLAEAIAEMDAQATRLAAADKFSGQLLVARGDQVLLDKAWGLADREAGKPVTRDTQFRMGSMNKMFTTVAIFQLIEAGKIKLTDPLITFLPDYPNKDLAATVTIRHLLTHTGGTGDFFGPGFDDYRLQLRDHAAFIRQFGARPLLAEPGAGYKYSNYGFILLGAVIEKVSGMSYYDYVEKAIYRPSGMTHTGSLPEEVEVPQRAKGYMKRDGAWVSHVGTLTYRGNAAGGGYSTTGDMLLFARALQAGKLISAASLHAATDSGGNGNGFGLGFMHDGEGASRMFGHNGGAPGMNGALWIYPKAGYVVIGLSNLDPGAAARPMLHFTKRMPL